MFPDAQPRPQYARLRYCWFDVTAQAGLPVPLALTGISSV